MKTAEFKGVFPVLVAPFDEEGRLVTEDIKKMVRFQIKAGADGIAFGFMTEFYKLADAEKLEILKVASEEAGGEIPVIASINEQSTDLAVWKAEEMVENGADALMVIPPFIIPAGKAAFVNHVQAVARAVKVPVIVQYSPIETGVALDAITLVELMDSCENLKYLKIESKPPGPVISRVLEKAPELNIFVGYSGLQLIDALKRGAVGVMPGAAITDIYARIFKLYNAGKYKETLTLHSRLVPFLNYNFQSLEMLIKLDKVVLKRRGIISTDYCRKPDFILDQKGEEVFEDYYQQLKEEIGLIET